MTKKPRCFGALLAHVTAVVFPFLVSAYPAGFDQPFCFDVYTSGLGVNKKRSAAVVAVIMKGNEIYTVFQR